ncbi:bifunctional phosphopantothenoylcysteine decarboxylase/phosphopantothenate--cysteine ligase CoaBC [Mariluticola halotolerans]|uniref:bifunctional phosphopantothenoylcysteine decarboxylase/phosphopantothenate--cysteine ligase CoaBC n=1 Tax=Mariluticola halotolerans TaxID=2909283 RepID=UPI0026E42A2C|nr:bifunctional phosphopantothenoylcysteine decarboxylase/phosphopantothenate--cysteine ligase CoaBC [Mariluticola halotolerans]UJQ93460.1 bifunctional phosphopantothenoylcysteine decarboxylase/phosphopantothenate--cysteine ligase CoaBC [Mariluticola halotolerans]
MTLSGKHILLIITGGIAAYKALELIRLIQKQGGSVQPILTQAATEFVTPLSASTLSGHAALTALFDLTREAEIGHIELSRSADLIVVAPASADFLAKMAQGRADDLASTTILATDTDILVAPAMNVRMWEAAATQRNLKTLSADGVQFAGPDEGEMACGEFGPGRMAEPSAILGAISNYFATANHQPLAGRHVIVTSGPTREWIDPVRYISNASSGKQGTAIAEALVAQGARVSFITGPAEAAMPTGCEIIAVDTALQMHEQVMAALAAQPADAAIFCAAVADWRAAIPATSKIKKQDDADVPALKLLRNPDILAEVSALDHDRRPALVVGFAAETDNVLAHARAKLKRKGCDWLLANDVGAHSNVFGGDANHIILMDSSGEDDWGTLSKRDAGHKLAQRLVAFFTPS